MFHLNYSLCSANNICLHFHLFNMCHMALKCKKKNEKEKIDGWNCWKSFLLNCRFLKNFLNSFSPEIPIFSYVNWINYNKSSGIYVYATRIFQVIRTYVHSLARIQCQSRIPFHSLFRLFTFSFFFFLFPLAINGH